MSRSRAFPDGTEAERGYTDRGQRHTVKVDTTTVDTRGDELLVVILPDGDTTMVISVFANPGSGGSVASLGPKGVPTSNANRQKRVQLMRIRLSR